ncbi:MAG: nucleotidyltransferase [Bacteroidetes bacterium]|nr:nucleotidyltransferase [Bacteroidota bacterium]
MKPTLVILAAGMASRYGSQKQTEGFGPNGETIMDYSIYDAIKAGFKKVVFIIRKDFAEPFKANFEKKLNGKIETDYVFQEMDSYVEKDKIPADRTKPWGTAHAVLCSETSVSDPFAVINADDFYGFDAFKKAHDFLVNETSDKKAAIIGYKLQNTLSEHGTVSRGVCEVDENGNLLSITERTKIYREGEKVFFEDENGKHEVPANSSVSMNFWCFSPSIFGLSEKLFHEFVEKNSNNIKAEFFIPIVADHFIKNNGGSIEVVSTSAQWFGVTYKEDAPSVKEKLETLIQNGSYPKSLWG